MANDPHDASHDEPEPTLPSTGEPIPPIDFTTFVMSLSKSALVHMALTPGPDGRYHEEDLPLARENIDILALLEDKTKGNLTGAEERFLHQVLFDLRMRFIDQAKRTRR